jgi:hypothetical protein
VHLKKKEIEVVRDWKKIFCIKAAEELNQLFYNFPSTRNSQNHGGAQLCAVHTAVLHLSF